MQNMYNTQTNSRQCMILGVSMPSDNVLKGFTGVDVAGFSKTVSCTSMRPIYSSSPVAHQGNSHEHMPVQSGFSPYDFLFESLRPSTVGDKLLERMENPMGTGSCTISSKTPNSQAGCDAAVSNWGRWQWLGLR